MNSTLNCHLLLLIASLIFSFQGGECLSTKEAVQRSFQYFKKDDPTGIPVLEMADPMPVPPGLGGGSLPLITVGHLYGLSRMKIEGLMVDLKDLKGSFNCTVPQLEIIGNYTWSSYEGQLNYSMIALEISFNASMVINDKGVPQIEDFYNEIYVDYLDFNMSDVSWAQQFILDAVDVLFYDIVDMITQQVKPDILARANKHLEEIFHTIQPTKNNIYDWSSQIVPESPGAILLRRMLQIIGADPLRIPDFSKSFNGVELQISGSQLEGLSLIGNIQTLSAEYQDKKIHFQLSMTHPHLMARTKIRIDDHITDMILDMEDVKCAFNTTFDLSLKEPPKLGSFFIKMGSLKKCHNQGVSLAQKCRKVEPLPMHDKFNALFTSDNEELVKLIQDNLDKINWEEEIMKSVQ